MIRQCFLAILVGFYLSHISCAKDYYVAPHGSDSNQGALESPFASLSEARDHVRDYKKAHPEESITVWLRGGTYPLTETVVFTLADSGSEKQTITYAAYQNEKPVFSAGTTIQSWERLAKAPKDLPAAAHGQVWVADVSFLRKIKTAQQPSPTVATQMDRLSRILTLYADGKPLQRAQGERFLIHKIPEEVKEIDRSFGFPEGALRNWDDLSEAEITIIPVRRWISFTLPLESVDEEKHIARTLAIPTYSLQPHGSVSKIKDAQIENSIALLDKPGEWVHDSRTDKIYYWPQDNQQPRHITAPVLTELIRVEGKTDYDGPVDVAVQHLVFRGLTFTQGERFRWQGQTGWGVQHDWERFDSPSAMVRLRGAENCAVEDCYFTTAGASGLRLDLHCKKMRIVGNHLHHLGGVGILLSGYGPGTKDVNSDNLVENNLIHHIGQIYHGSPALFVWQSSHNRIANNEIHDIPYTGICVTGRIVWGEDGREECSQTIRWNEVKDDENAWSYADRKASWYVREKYLHSRNNTVSRNDLHAVMQRCGDGNFIYISGGGGGNLVAENFCHDCPSKTMNCSIRCDDDQNNTLITRNIICRIGGDGEGFNSKGKNDFVENLIVDMRSNSNHHRGYIRFYGGVVKDSVYQRNVYYARKIGHNSLHENPSLRNTTGYRLRDTKADYNLIFCTNDATWGPNHLREQRAFGIEEHSISADPMFVDIDNNNFQFKPGSPAFKLGLKQPVKISEVGLREPYRSRLQKAGQ